MENLQYTVNISGMYITRYLTPNTRLSRETHIEIRVSRVYGVNNFLIRETMGKITRTG